MRGVCGMRLVIVAEMPVDVRVLANRAVRARCDDFVGGAKREHAPVEHQQTIEPFVDAIEVVRRYEHR